MYPIYNMDYRICMSCGEKTVSPCDSRGFQTSELMIYSVTHMKCKNCGKQFYIKWVPKNEEEPDNLIPVCIEKEELNSIGNKIIDFAKSYKNKGEE